MAAPQDVHVQICNQEIKFDLEVKALIQDIQDCSGPLSELTEQNTKVKEKFQQLKNRIQELEQSAKEQDKESEKQLLLQEVENHKKQMFSNQTSWWKASLTCKLAIDNLEKAELLHGGDSLRQRRTTEESLAQTSSTITDSLMGISRMMSQQVQQSEEAMQTLVSSSQTLLDANEEFKSMSGTVQLSRKLITKYNRRELTDQASHLPRPGPVPCQSPLYCEKAPLSFFVTESCQLWPASGLGALKDWPGCQTGFPSPSGTQ